MLKGQMNNLENAAVIQVPQQRFPVLLHLQHSQNLIFRMSADGPMPASQLIAAQFSLLPLRRKSFSTKHL